MALELSNFLETNKDRLSPLLILTHDYPDPDALASAFALQHLAEFKGGIRSRIVHGKEIGRIENQEMVRLLKIPVHKCRPSDFRRFANIALVDTQPGFENNSLPRNSVPVIVIDHHMAGKLPSVEFPLTRTDVGSTSTLLAEELLESGAQIPMPLATALVYGIISDTLNFYRMPNQETVDTYQKLLPFSDVHILARIQNPHRPRRFFGELSHCLARAHVRQRLIVSHLGLVESPDTVSQMADFLLGCEGIQWTFCTGRHGENIHASLRTSISEGGAGLVLRDVFEHPRQAGGHGQIAGGRLKIGGEQEEQVWQQAETLLTERLVKRLHLRSNTSFRPLIQEGSQMHSEG
jgi:nanoRNase/pAp phosphatase (c-di-AMP/oligoRNAs hydrolase)